MEIRPARLLCMWKAQRRWRWQTTPCSLASRNCYRLSRFNVSQVLISNNPKCSKLID